MSSRSTDRQINIRAVDRSTSTMMGMVRTMRAVGQEIRILTMLMTALAAAEDLATMGGASFMRIARLGLLGVAGALSIGAAVQVTQQGNILPVGQTLPGQFRIVHATGPALVHAGEIISRPRETAGDASGLSLTQNFNITGGDPEQIAQAIERKTRTLLRTLTPWMPR